eukprot:scaffold19298_cov62-Phaeocystis_antarctica.AAC.8
MYPTYRITRLQGLISALDDALFGSKSFGTAFDRARTATLTRQRTVASHEQRHSNRARRRARATTRRTSSTTHRTAIALASARVALAVAQPLAQQRRAAVDATDEPAAQISWGSAQRCRRKWAEPAAQKGARVKGRQC